MLDLDGPGQAAGQADPQDLERHQAGRDESHQEEVLPQPGGEQSHAPTITITTTTGTWDGLVHVSPGVGNVSHSQSAWV